ncbi:MAG: enoyl-CoA hydratase/isomerase family protein [Candidatus Solibacter sp.]
MTDLLLSAREGRLLRLTLNRLAKRNALDAALCRRLVDALDAASADPSVGAILLTANGTVFCAGMDLAEIEQAGDTQEIGHLHEQLFTVSSRLAKPLIAAVHGAALGGGTGLVANCHIVVAGPQATFGLTEIRLGLWPFLVYRAVEAALGPRRTLELALTGRTFGPAEARDFALAHELAPDPEARAHQIARSLADSSPTAVQTGLDFVQRVKGLDWQAAGVVAQQMRNQVFNSEDFREGLRAFREKRPPEWPSAR